MDAPLISIIVPIYNAGDALNRCIDSVLNQTFHDWELLLIDDGCTDKSGEICDEYSIKDQRIQVFHKPNGGVSSARNIGLNHAKGEWIVFVDADDFVKESYLSHILEHSRKNVDLVISYAEIHNGDDIKKESYPSKLVDNTNFESIFIENDMHWHTSPWSKLYKRNIIEEHHIRFCEGMHIGEDAVFLYSYMLYSNRIYISNDTDYCYSAYNEGSLTKRVNSLVSEILAYNQIRAIVEAIILKKNIKNFTAMKNLNWLIGSYQRRILNALYYNNVQKQKRLSVLTESDWIYYIKYIHSSSLKECILIALLKAHFYRFYDFIRVFAVLKNKSHYAKG